MLGLRNNDAVSSVTLISAGSAATAGVAGSPYSIVPSNAAGSGLGNYTISYLPGALNVTAAPLTLTALNQTKVYGNAFNFNGTEFSSVGLRNNDAITSVSLTSAGAMATATVVGSPYSIVPSNALGSGLGNYAISYLPGALSVTPATLSLTALNQSKVYGNAFPFNGTEFSSVGLRNSDAVSGVTLTSAGALATAGVAGSPYAIVASNAAGTGLGNYTISYLPGALSVTPAALTLTALNQSKVYGNPLSFNGTEFSSLGLRNSDAVSSITLTSAGALATASVAGSPYSIVPSNATGTGLGNYTISYLPGALSITPAALTLTALNQSKVYGNAFSFNGTEFSSVGLRNSDAVGSVTLTSAGALATAGVAGSPYSIVPSSAVGTGLGNYTVSYLPGALAVTPAPLTLTALNQTKVYGNAFSFNGTEFSSEGLRNSDVVNSVSLASAGSIATAGVTGSPYSIVASNATGAGLGNYTISYLPGALSVTPASLTLTALNQSKVYGNAVNFNGTEFSSVGLRNSDVVSSITLTSAGTLATAGVAGSPYSIVASNATGPGLGNYTISYLPGALSVTPASLTLTALNQSKVYGNAFSFNGTEFSSLGLRNNDVVSSVTLTSAGAVATAGVAGSPYAIVASNAAGPGLGNYTISYLPGALSVAPAELTLTALNQTKVYGNAFNFNGTEFSSLGLRNNDAVSSVTLTSAGSVATAGVAGSPYSIVSSNAVGSGLGNYTISYLPGMLSVTPAALTLTALNQSKVYGNTLTFNGTEFSSLGLRNNDAVSSVTLISAGSAATAGVAGSPYSIVPSNAAGSGLGNYTISYLPGALNVTAAPLTLTALNQTKVYGNAFNFNGTEFSSLGLRNSDAVSGVTLTSAGALATSGVAGSPYSIVASNAAGTGLGNYTISYLPGTLSVTPASLTLTALNQSKVYGNTFSFNGTEFSSLGLRNSDVVNSVSLASAGSIATAGVAGSPYSIVASNATGAGLGNYTISYLPGALSVTPASLTLTALNQSKVYGNTFTFNGTEFSSVGLRNSDAVSSVSLNSAGSIGTAGVAGTPYSIVASNALGTGLGNYTIAYLPGALTVTRAPLTLTALNQSKVYGNTLTFAGTEFSASGLRNGETIASVALSSPGAASAASIEGSPYAISIANPQGGSFQAANYSIGFVNGTLSVTPFSLVITASNLSKVYGNTLSFKGTEFSSIGLVNGDSLSSVTLNSAGAIATAGVSGSPYSIMASEAVGTGLQNYTISYLPGMLSVTPAALTLTALNQSKVYGNTLTFNGTEFSSLGLRNNDAVSSVTLISAGSAATAGVAGSPYSIVPSNAAGSGLGNYTISYLPGALNVTAAPLTLTALNQTKVYGNAFNFNGTEFSSVGLRNNDAITSVSLTSAGAMATATVVGSPYSIVPSNALGSGLGNYAISYLPGALSVTPATLTLTALNQSKVYGNAFPFNGTEFSSVGLRNSDAVSGVTLTSAGALATAGVAGSPYAIVASNAAGTGLGNYTISYLPGALSVTPAALTLTALNQSKVYGNPLSFNGTEFSSLGLRNSDAVSSITLTSAGALATASVAGSPYTIVASNAVGTGLGNYTISYLPGALNVTPAPLTVTALNQSKIYGETLTFSGTEFSSVGLRNSDAITTVNLISAGAAAIAGVAEPLLTRLLLPTRTALDWAITRFRICRARSLSRRHR